MRPIKFRAWDRFKQKYWFDIQRQRIERDMYPDLMDPGFEYTLSDDDLVVEQYTGLKDKKGVEIYEGDVIRGDTGWIGKIIWSRFGFRVVILDNIQPDSFSLDYVSPNIQVLGNVHENLE